MTDSERTHRVVVIGGGFGGLYAAKSLARAGVSVTLVDRRNFHLFQPLLYQIATGGTSPGDICSPLRSVLGGSRDTRVLQAEVTGIDAERREVVLTDGRIAYDTLIVAAGSHHHYFGHDEWARSRARSEDGRRRHRNPATDLLRVRESGTRAAPPANAARG